MTCGRARRLLWPDAGPREATAEVVIARQHASACADCGRFLDDMRRLGERIGEAAPRAPAPAEVRDRLFEAIARARSEGKGGRRGSWRRRVGAGLAAALVLGGAWLGWRTTSDGSPRQPEALGAIADDHLRSQRATGLRSSDSVEVARWLGERLPFAVAIPLFPDARLTGARVLLLEGRAGAVVEYAIAGRSLSYYILPDGGRHGSSEQRRVRLASHAGYRMAVWADAGLTHALIAGLSGARLVELAHFCIAQMTGATDV